MYKYVYIYTCGYICIQVYAYTHMDKPLLRASKKRDVCFVSVDHIINTSIDF